MAAYWLVSAFFFFYSSEWIARLKGGQTKNSINVLSSNLAPEQRGAQAGSKWGDEARAKKVWTAKLQKAEKKGQSKRVYDKRSHRKFSPESILRLSLCHLKKSLHGHIEHLALSRQSRRRCSFIFSTLFSNSSTLAVCILSPWFLTLLGEEADPHKTH